MRMCDHPNVLSCYASFVHENELWLVMEFMSKGSCLHVMNVAKKEVTNNRNATSSSFANVNNEAQLP